jgi:hypothetical protein
VNMIDVNSLNQYKDVCIKNAKNFDDSQNLKNWKEVIWAMINTKR